MTRDEKIKAIAAELNDWALMWGFEDSDLQDDDGDVSNEDVTEYFEDKAATILAIVEEEGT